MKRVVQALVLTAAAGAAAFLPAPGQAALPTGSTCWLTCISLTTGVQRYKAFNVSQNACCSGSYMSCPPGAYATYAWGEPAELCPLNGVD